MVARTGRPTAEARSSERDAAVSLRRSTRRTSWRAWIVPLLAGVLICATVAPALHSSMRGDDSHVGIDGRGAMRADHISLLGYVGDMERVMLRTGRLMPISVAQGQIYATEVPERLPFKLGIVLASILCVVVLLAFLRTLGVRSPYLLIAVAVAFALSLQFRATHDPALGYNASSQLTVLELLLGLIAYAKYLATGSRRWYAAAIVGVLILVFTYEANPPLVLAFAALHLGRSRRWREWKPVVPILAIGAAMTLVSMYLHSHAKTVVEGYQDSLDPILVVQTAARQAVSAIPDIYFLSGSQGLLDAPTRAELFGAFWRAALAGGLLVFALLGLRRRRTIATTLAARTTAIQIAVIGVVMMAGSGLYISFAKQHQQLIFLGGGHLATFAGTIGFVLAAVAAGLVWGRTVSRSLLLVWSLGLLVFWMVFASSYSNFRVVAIEQPGIEQRDLIEAALGRGIVNSLRPGTTLYLTNRDMNWNFGNLVFYGGTDDYLVFLRSGIKLDVRTLGPPPPTCGPPSGFPVADCATPSKRVALLAVRASRGGGTAVLAAGIPWNHVNDAGARTLIAVAHGASAAGDAPSLVGTKANGSPWSASQQRWTRRNLGGGWVRYATTVGGGGGPIAPSITDPRSAIDFTVPMSPGSLVRLFGTKRLLP